MQEFTISKAIDAPFDAALERLKAAVTAEGFGILYNIDFSDIIANKTGQPLPGRVVGLGVCDPKSARRALSVSTAVAALLPCAAYVAEENGATRVGVLDPQAALGIAALPELEPLGRDTRERLERAVRNA
jgi:uncharacterized protein (DUF302 family)